VARPKPLELMKYEKGIIGRGQIGGNLARRFTALGHEVAVADSRGPETLTDFAAETAQSQCQLRKWLDRRSVPRGSNHSPQATRLLN